MDTPGSVTDWLAKVRAGDQVVAEKLWGDYFGRLVGLARAKLAGRPRTLDDPEDVALSAFNSFFQAAQRGRFPKLNDRHDLSQLLILLTERKAIDAVRREQAAKRQGGAADPLVSNVVDSGPTPSFAAAVAEQFELLLTRLPDAELRKIAMGKLEGYTNEELATRLTRSVATIERKLALIRRVWEAEALHD